jgi:hypothetical protein
MAFHLTNRLSVISIVDVDVVVAVGTNAHSWEESHDRRGFLISSFGFPFTFIFRDCLLLRTSSANWSEIEVNFEF